MSADDGSRLMNASTDTPESTTTAGIRRPDETAHRRAACWVGRPRDGAWCCSPPRDAGRFRPQLAVFSWSAHCSFPATTLPTCSRRRRMGSVHWPHHRADPGRLRPLHRFTATAAGMLAAGTAQTYGMAGGADRGAAVRPRRRCRQRAIVTRWCVGLHRHARLSGRSSPAVVSPTAAGASEGVRRPPTGLHPVGPRRDRPDPRPRDRLDRRGRGGLPPARAHGGRRCRMYAVGGNPVAARLSGIDKKRARLIAFALSGLLAGLADLTLTSSLGVGNPTSALSYLLPASRPAWGGDVAGRHSTPAARSSASSCSASSPTGWSSPGSSEPRTTAAQGIVLVAAVTISTFARRVAAR